MSKLYTKDNIEAFIFTSNKKDFLKESITSILNQTIGNISITVIDIASSDGTGDLVYQMSKEHPNIKYYWHGNCENKVEVFKVILKTKLKLLKKLSSLLKQNTF